MTKTTNYQEADNLAEYDFDWQDRYDDLPILRDSGTGEPYVINAAGEKVWID